MATFSKQFLSGSTNGRGILIAATATPGTTIHAAHATSKDEVWLWAMNTDTTARKLTIEYGGTGTADLIELTIPAEGGLVLVVPGLVASGSISIAGFAATTNVINVMGYVNRIT